MHVTIQVNAPKAQTNLHGNRQKPN